MIIMSHRNVFIGTFLETKFFQGPKMCKGVWWRGNGMSSEAEPERVRHALLVVGFLLVLFENTSYHLHYFCLMQSKLYTDNNWTLVDYFGRKRS